MKKAEFYMFYEQFSHRPNVAAICQPNVSANPMDPSAKCALNNWPSLEAIFSFCELPNASEILAGAATYT